TALIVIASLLAYFFIACWMWGFCCARFAGNYNIVNRGAERQPSWYYDENAPRWAAVFWPFYVLFALFFGKTIKWLAKSGEKRGHKSYKARKVRIALEQKIQIEQERIEREAEAEVEETLRGLRSGRSRA